jgi:hypothetical protein
MNNRDYTETDLCESLRDLRKERARRIRELEVQIKDAFDLIDTYSMCVDGYYIERGHSRITEHEEYDAKWRPEE